METCWTKCYVKFRPPIIRKLHLLHRLVVLVYNCSFTLGKKWHLIGQINKTMVSRGKLVVGALLFSHIQIEVVVPA